MDKVTKCAQILWSVTRNLAPNPGEEGRLAEARLELAKLIYSLDGEGFPSPLLPEAAQRRSPEWGAVVDAATKAFDLASGISLPPLGTHAVLWPADNPRAFDSLPAQSPVLPLTWAYSRDPSSQVANRYGPFIDRAAGNQEVVLFVFKAIDRAVALRDDADASPGLYPRRWIADLRSAEVSSAQFKLSRNDMIWATVLALLALVLAVYTVAGVYVASEFAHGAVNQMHEGVEVEVKGVKTAIKCVADGTKPLQWDRDGDNGTLCDKAWAQAWLMQNPAPTNQDTALVQKIKEANGTSKQKDWWDNVKKWFWKPTNAQQNLSLLWPLIDGAVAITLLILAAGLIGRGYLGGALIDQRNRVSLERLQQISWTVVILGGYAVLALFNAALLSSYIREQMQKVAVQEITGVATATHEVSTYIPNLLPSMDPTLWAVLGITAVLSPYLSRRIMASKSQPNTGDFQQVQATSPIGAFDPLDIRPEPGWSRWSDLFMGESEANRNSIDVSRLQHLVITILLLFTYVLFLVDYVRSLSGEVIMLAMTSGVPVFPAMPPVDATFVGLLALSHAGYLAFKSIPKGDSASGAGGGTS